MSDSTLVRARGIASSKAQRVYAHPESVNGIIGSGDAKDDRRQTLCLGSYDPWGLTAASAPGCGRLR